ncbi:hypothetical protein HanXRQr2_Chr03g0104331 [Helianthus annuus]|uniref:Uncharacterized protein n=1 Tax=Helianthus annuus TaxID=4232 RepID=A0A9K3JF96_HELAN|nr:hypothetical protein HanXRQr2_Chr03g0104331 [Helianthus annuus]KAJ0943164.1 hypothetical protein HanPSC8_Chr03g0100811 [Helianthus annuus]
MYQRACIKLTLTLSSSLSDLSLSLISSISRPNQSTELDDSSNPLAVLELPTPPCPRLAEAILHCTRTKDANNGYTPDSAAYTC